MISHESIQGVLLGASSGPPPLAGGSGKAVVPAAPGGATATGDAAAAPPAGMGFDPIFLMLAVIGGLVIFSMFGSRKEKKKREQMLSTLGKHDRVQTLGGIIGSIVEVKPDTVLLQVDDASKIRMTFSRTAIATVLEKQESNSDD